VDDSRFRPDHYRLALSPVAKTRAHVGDVQRQQVADGDEGEGMAGVVAGEPLVDLGDERAGSTGVHDDVALERPDRILEHRDGQGLLRAHLAARPGREAVHVLVCVIEHSVRVVAPGPGRQNTDSCARERLYVDLRMTRPLSSDGGSS
jgi:hypothetical protein